LIGAEALLPISVQTNLKASWPLFVGGYVVYVGMFSYLELRLLANALWWAGFASLAVLVKVGVEWYRPQQADELTLVYDERAEPAVRTLDLTQ
jgi:hypothetical protein